MGTYDNTNPNNKDNQHKLIIVFIVCMFMLCSHSHVIVLACARVCLCFGLACVRSAFVFAVLVVFAG